MIELVKVSCKAPTPTMIAETAKRFERLRKIVFDGSGVDFLARCGDVFRPAAFRSTKDGVAFRSWHKTGRAFDYDQENKALVIVSEPRGGKQYFRTYLRCADQSGVLGKKLRVRDYRGYTVDAYLFDFSAAAEAVGFIRIPAWSGWQRSYNRREFWHYQDTPAGLTWDAAMKQIAGQPKPKAAGAVLGLNDRGDAVKALQTRLIDLKHLATNEADGVFGAKTKAAVIAFQRANKLAIDGLVGPNTRKALGL